MKRDVQGILLVLLGVTVLRIVTSGQYLYYVAEAMGRWLLLSSAVLIVLGGWMLWDQWRVGRSPAATAPSSVESDAGHRDRGPTDSGETDSGHLGADRGDGHPGHAEGHGGPRIALLLLLPVLAVYVVAPAALGSYSASRQQAAVLPPSDELGVPPLPPGNPVELTVRDYVTRAVWDEGRTLADRSLRMVGFVTPDPDGGWWLTRMGMACCAADAQAFRVEVLTGQEFPADTWVSVTGTWLPGGGPDEPIARLAAADIRQVPQPRNPYQ